MPNISASSADRASKCAASHALPAVFEESSDAAEKGDIVHNYIRCMLSKAATPLVPPEYLEYCKAIPIEAIVDGLEIMDTEASFLLDLQTKSVRYLGSNLGRNYPDHGPYEIPLTVDLVARDSKNFYEIDWKTGQTVESPEDNWQRRLCASALLLHYGRDSIISKNIYLRDEGGTFQDQHEFSVLDVYSFIEEFTRVVDAVLVARRIVSDGGVPDTFPGDHCKYCPAMSFCPAKTALVRKFSEDLTEQDLVVKILSLPPEAQGNLMVRVKEIKSIVEQAEKILREQAIDHPLPVGDKHEYRPIDRQRQFFDKDAALGLLKSLGIDDDGIAKLYKTTLVTEVRKLKK